MEEVLRKAPTFANVPDVLHDLLVDVNFVVL